MRVYSVEQSLFSHTDPPPYGGMPVTRYFRSHTEARKWANSVVKQFIAMNRGWDKGFRLADIGWDAEITIQACDFASTGKDMLVALLNYDGGYFHKSQTVEQWNPQDKWHKPQSRGEE